MPKILTIDEMLEVARAISLSSYDRHVLALETAATELAQDVAGHLGVAYTKATWEGMAYEGVCACFLPKRPDQACPAVLQALDKGGDWESMNENASVNSSSVQ